ncbi:hypothetical protein [Asanoa siamensis]|uniref:Uncharacterized protein n=1 Tax=Asanoa siamensis TaxID=926357 RepID=A0ABQ4CSQ9_9ACTN|nr:hypothetical protein [Asanoa siamensis]GIF74326.1 hypothetical protein Asi02nite_38440 [Asanoa siamensis]
MHRSRIASFTAGMLVANAAPHLATAVTRRRHLTPLAGRDSGPAVNGAWAALNVAVAVGLLTWSARGKAARWDADLVAFGFGHLTFAAWMAASEAVAPMNH